MQKLVVLFCADFKKKTKKNCVNVGVSTTGGSVGVQNDAATIHAFSFFLGVFLRATEESQSLLRNAV